MKIYDTTMQTLDSDKAAEFLGICKDTLYDIVAKDTSFPAAKIGKAWIFVDVDLIEWIRAKYPSRVKGKKWHSTNEAVYGGSMSLLRVDELDDLLGRHQKQKPAKQKPNLKAVQN